MDPSSPRPSLASLRLLAEEALVLEALVARWAIHCRGRPLLRSPLRRWVARRAQLVAGCARVETPEHWQHGHAQVPPWATTAAMGSSF